VIREDLFYCLSCSLELPVHASAKLFKTGYYRFAMRLGLCAGCAARSETGLAGDAGRRDSGGRDGCAGDAGRAGPGVPEAAGG